PNHQRELRIEERSEAERRQSDPTRGSEGAVRRDAAPTGRKGVDLVVRGGDRGAETELERESLSNRRLRVCFACGGQYEQCGNGEPESADHGPRVYSRAASVWNHGRSTAFSRRARGRSCWASCARICLPLTSWLGNHLVR